MLLESFIAHIDFIPLKQRCYELELERFQTRRAIRISEWTQKRPWENFSLLSTKLTDIGNCASVNMWCKRGLFVGRRQGTETKEKTNEELNRKGKKATRRAGKKPTH